MKLWKIVGLLFLSGGHVRADEPGWTKSLEFLSQLFDPDVILGGFGPTLEKFQLLFTGIGVTLLIVGTVMKLAKASHGEEQLGWVSTMVLSAALIVTGPSLGKMLYSAMDDTAKWTGYDKFSSVKGAWDTLTVVMQEGSPVIDSAISDTPPPEESKTDKSWLSKAWDWTKSVGTGIKDLATGIFSAVRNGVTRIIWGIMMLVPIVGLTLSVIIMFFMDFMKVVLFHGGNVFLPAAIACLSFEPTRGAARSFILKYVAVAFWPIGWAFGNAICFSMLAVLSKWIVSSSMVTIAAATGTGTVGVIPAVGSSAAVGVFAAASAYMSWGLLFVIAVLLLSISLLIILNAIFAPRWMTKLITEGASFVGSMMTAGVAAGALSTAAVATGGAALVSGGGASMGAIGGGKLLSGLAGRAKSAMGGVASRLQQTADAGGAMSGLAGLGARAFGAGASVANVGGNAVKAASIRMANTMKPQGGGAVASSILGTVGRVGQAVSRFGGEEARAGHAAMSTASEVVGTGAAVASRAVENTRPAQFIRRTGGRALDWARRGRDHLQ